MKNQTTGHYSEIDFIRIIACFGVVLYHYIHEEEYHFFHSFDFVNGSWAHLLVTVFFTVSGFVLYKKYAVTEHLDLKDFYIRRARSMYPLFYISYIYTALAGVFTGALKISVKPLWTWILTVFEVDGYFSARFDTHYLIGEWFAGALIILYLIFPLLLKMIRKHPFSLMAFLVIADLMIDYYDLPTLSIIYSSLFNCALRLYLGMLCAKYDIQNSRYVPVVSALYLLIYCTVEIPYLRPVLRNAAGFAMFLVLFRVGKDFLKLPEMQKPVRFLSKLTYPVFLIHAATIKGLLMFIQPGSWVMFWMIYVLVIIASLIQAFILDCMTSYLLKLIRI